MCDDLRLLLSDVKRQLDATSPYQHETRTSPIGDAAVITLSTQSNGYHLVLAELHRALSEWSTQETGSKLEDVFLSSTCQSHIWKLLAFCKPSSSYLNPDRMKNRCADIQKIRGKCIHDGSQTEDIWQNPHLHSWIVTKESGLIIIQGNSQSINCLKAISIEALTQLEERCSTIFILGEPLSCEYFIGQNEVELLRQLAIQGLRKIPVPWHASFLSGMATRFRKALSCQDWFKILGDIFTLIPDTFLIVDVNVLGSQAEHTRMWATMFQQLIDDVKAKAATRLSVMLLSSRPLSLENIDSPAVTVLSDPKSLQRQGGIFLKRRTGPVQHWPDLVSKRQRQSNQERGTSITRWEPTSNGSIQKPGWAINITPQSTLPTVPTSERIGENGTGRDNSRKPDNVATSGNNDDISRAVLSSRPAPSPPSSRHDFKIAIICALTLEANAVETLFDQHWNIHIYGKSEGDMNSYYLGMIGLHNVVLAFMPGMGKGNAATVAANCRASFPGIRLALVVGICGGVPFTQNSTEILLGDVVISDGLVQYDFGRKFPDGFRRKETTHDNLRKPPEEIRSFLSKLKGRRASNLLHEKTKSHLKILRQQLGGCAVYPGVEEDILFEPTYRHNYQILSSPQGVASEDDLSRVDDTTQTPTCEEVGCDLNKLVTRSRHNQSGSITGDSQQTSNPIIHFGTFASGDTVMKSGEDRDEIATREGVVAFEMEGAGVWEIFPCVIIKGVCDYADSHKNKKWQDYAAAAAASCMKAFLEDWVVRASRDR